ncbi:MAG: circularly permuted type 2 ATP-grasp protein [Terriglobales bacterium]
MSTLTRAAETWHGLLRPEVEMGAAFCDDLAARMRAARLTFGDRVHCPFLRPFFLDEADEQRVRKVVETIAAVGERVVQAALESPPLLAQAALSEAEDKLVRIDPGYKTALTASRLDSFLLPDSLQFAEYNAESPAGLGYAESLAELFAALPLMSRFEQMFAVRAYPLSRSILEALMASYREWGGTASPPVIAIVDFREVPTWTEFELLQSRFEKRGVPTVVADPRDLEFDGTALRAAGRKIDLLYRRVLINDIVSRAAECDALVRAYTARAVCVANTLRCKIPHKKSFFAMLTDDANQSLFTTEERGLIRQHIPWTRLLREGRSTYFGESVDLVPYVRKRRNHLVIKPNDEYGGTGVNLGWEMDEREWDAAIQAALADAAGAWVVQERIAVRRETFPQFEPGSGATMRDVLVDLAPYIFRGKFSGFLTRLSATGLANVSSGGGQVPLFVVKSR